MSEASDGARPGPLRTVDVARATEYSVQQVRDLERLGVIPPATRSDNGYRTYTSVHVGALRAYRGLAMAVGPVTARQVLSRLRTRTLAEAASAISALHVQLANEREEALRAQQALRAIQAEADTSDVPVRSTSAENGSRAPGVEHDGDAMTITQLAGALGVRPSTLRFWEEEGLVVPERVTSLRARRYGLAATRTARIVAALRSTGHGIPAVREIVGALNRFDGREETLRLLGERLDRIAARTIALLRAGADLAAVISSVEGRSS
ncbi:MerR family transcriptional regulator [Streptomyces sp. Y7]|uniref:MerR family transcriptional regulator n=1 Tax=Streptomyces sp. Y7 TaxID=3342392 RepID=UPI003712908A